ncbi:MAG: HlyD family efflux transporter periplasmic adaptor subunit [Burkholderiales bacterium]
MAELPQAPTPGARRRRALSFVIIAFVLVGVGWATWWYLESRGHQTTDNAYVGGNLVQVTPQVAGTVVAIGADDTDLVEAGQTLVRLDAADAKVALAQAEAQLAQAVRTSRTVYANNSVLDAAVAQRAAELRKAEDDLARRIELDAKGMVTKEDLEHARSSVAAAKAALLEARERLASNRALTERIGVEDQPSVKDAAARVRVAFLAVERNEIPAPVTGYVAKRVVQVGQRVAAGDPLMAVVPLDEVWVEANFKEVQLRDMRIGQPVRLTADLYGSHVEYRGRVAGLAAGTGGAFALLPPQNATGNWIKVVQRLPVRIALDRKQVAAHPLRVGLSMEVDVDVRDPSGPQLAKAPVAGPVYATRAFDEQATAADARVREIIAANLGRGG